MKKERYLIFLLTLTLVLGAFTGCKKQEVAEEVITEEVEEVIEEVVVEPIEVEVSSVDIDTEVSKNFLSYLDTVEDEGFLYVENNNSEQPVLILNNIKEKVLVDKALLNEETKELEVTFKNIEVTVSEEDEEVLEEITEEVEVSKYSIFKVNSDKENIDVVKVKVNDNELNELILNIFRDEKVMEGIFTGLADNNHFELSVEDDFHMFNILQYNEEFYDMDIKEGSKIRVFYDENEHGQLEVKEIVLLEEPADDPILVEYMGDKDDTIIIKIGENLETIYLEDMADEFKELELAIGELINVKYEEMFVKVKETTVEETEESTEEVTEVEATLTPQKVLTFVERFDLTKVNQETKGTPSELVIEILEDGKLLSEKSNKLINLLSKKKGYHIFEDYDKKDEYIVLISLGEQATGGYDLGVKDALVKDGQLYVLIDETKPEEGSVVTQAISNPHILVRLKNMSLDIRNENNIHVRNESGETYEVIKLNTAS